MNLPATIVFLLISLLFHPVNSKSTEMTSSPETEIKGTPRIIHYSRKDFNGDTQVWSMCQDQDGILYFGNNDGVLIFDGARWQKITLPNSSSVRSLLCTQTGKIYAGGFNEFGIIERDTYGKYSFKSLTDHLRQEERNLENIWAIHEVQDHVVFRSFSRLVALSANKVFTIPSSNFYYSTVTGNRLLLADPEGLKSLNLKSLQFEKLLRSDQLHGEIISAVVPGFSENQILIFTKAGLSYTFDLQTRQFSFFRDYLSQTPNNQILSVIKSKGGNLYLGTLSSQIMVLDQTGAPVQTEPHFMELQDNTVLNLYESAEGNIWALLNNGIDCINISSPVSILFENASVFDAMILGGKIYAATNQGVFVSERIVNNPYFATLHFTKMSGLEGQTWSLLQVEGKVLCSHDRGLFLLTAQGITPLFSEEGVWKVLPIRDQPDLYFVCTYAGIYMMHYTAGRFTVEKQIDGFHESSRDIIQGDEPGVFWICHGYKGIFKIRLDETFQRVVGLEHFRESGLPSPFSINVFRWKDQLVFTTNKGIYQYNDPQNEFVQNKTLNQIFGTEKNIRKLLPYPGKTWFIEDDEVGYVEDGSTQLMKGLFLELKGTFNRGMECILPINDTNVLIGTTTGLYAYDLSYPAFSSHHPTLISEVSYKNASERQSLPLDHPAQLPSEASDITFEFSSPRLKDQKQVQYSYLLSGMDKQWSEWTTEPYKTYTRLFPGYYEFKVKARSVMGELSSETKYSFSVLPMWYLTKWAFAGYLVLVAALIAAGRKILKTRITEEKAKTRVEEQKKQAVLHLELQHMRLEHEKNRIEEDKKILEEDVIFKSKELANYTMLLVRKRELLTELRDDLKGLKEFARNEKSRNMLRNLIRKIGLHLSNEEHIHVFEANFERVHSDFFQELRTHFPDLTSKELRLCALVKMNLSNKEIAPILNISLRGVETARYRLRKRLSLEHDENMVEFLEKLSP